VARCCAPSSPILLPARFSVVSVYVKKKNERFDEQVGMLHYFVEEQWQDVVLLVDRSDSSQGTVW
jgi:hypothetical protein